MLILKKKLSNCLLEVQHCIAQAVWWQSGMFLISLSEHEQGRAVAVPRTAFVPWYNMGLISLFNVGSSFQGTFVIPWEMLHTRVLTWLVSPHFTSCSIPDLPFVHVLRWVSCQHKQDLGDVPSSTCRTSWNWHQHSFTEYPSIWRAWEVLCHLSVYKLFKKLFLPGMLPWQQTDSKVFTKCISNVQLLLNQ